MSLSIEANSQPMAPPPTTTAVAGTERIDRSSSEVTTRSPSTVNPGSTRGTEPVARITWRPLSVTLPAPPLTVTVRPVPREPLPS